VRFSGLGAWIIEDITDLYGHSAPFPPRRRRA
jgi:hypothetical protein